MNERKCHVCGNGPEICSSPDYCEYCASQGIDDCCDYGGCPACSCNLDEWGLCHTCGDDHSGRVLLVG